MLSSRSINILYFYSTVPQGYFLLLWFSNVLLSCALMLVWKFDAPDTASPPSLHGGGGHEPLPVAFPLDLAPQLLLCTVLHISPPASLLFLVSFNFPLFLISLNVPERPTVTFRLIKISPAPPFMKYSPLVDLTGVAIHSAWNMVCGAFKELPGESCT